MQKINLSEKFSLFTNHWEPKVLEELNKGSQAVSCCTFQGLLISIRQYPFFLDNQHES